MACRQKNKTGQSDRFFPARAEAQQLNGGCTRASGRSRCSSARHPRERRSRFFAVDFQLWRAASVPFGTAPSFRPVSKTDFPLTVPFCLPAAGLYGGLARNRTGIEGFAVLCVTIPPRGLCRAARAPAYTKDRVLSQGVMPTGGKRGISHGGRGLALCKGGAGLLYARRGNTRFPDSSAGRAIDC
jgi:hypothetical protein